jgi:hypothetical protein
LKGDQRHRNDTTFGQRVSQHSLPTLLCFNFLPTAQNILKFSASRTNGTFGFARHTSRPFAKPKEPFFAIALRTIMRLKIVFWTIKN